MNLLRRLTAEPVVQTVILLNLLVLFLRAYPAQHGLRDWLFFLDITCLCFFVFELAAKIRLDGWPGFWAKGFNRFDFVVVAISAPTLLMAFTEADDWSFILVLRGARILRMFRVLRFVPEAERIWGGIARALRASLGVMLAFFIYNVLLGIFAGHMFGAIDPEHFGTPAHAIYTVFKAFTVEGWFEVPDAIAARATPGMAAFVRVFFIGAVVSGGLLGLGMVNAVFVDEMVADNQDGLEAQMVALAAQVEALRQENAELMGRIERRLVGPDPAPAPGESDG